MRASLLCLIAAPILACASAAERDRNGVDASSGFDSAGDAREEGVVDAGTDTAGEAGADSSFDAMPLPAGAAVEVSCGAQHTCARTVSGDVRCWGTSIAGEIGNGFAGTMIEKSPLPSVLSGAEQVVAGNAQTCALVSGSVRCWGGGAAGLLGDGVLPGPSSVLVATTVPGLAGILQLGASGQAVCALTAERRVKCWGFGLGGQLGYLPTTTCRLTGGSTPPCSAIPTEVPDVRDVGEIAFGAEHACVRTQTSGTLMCWGVNNYGQLGDGTTIGRWEAREVAGLPPIRLVRAGMNRTCALTTSGAVYCWGLKVDGFAWNAVTVPTLVTGFSGPVVDVRPGGTGSCALIADGSVQCWGDRAEYLPGTTSKSPVTIAGLTDIVSLCNPTHRACAVRKTGEIYCWGQSFLGDGTDGTTPTPQKVAW